MHLYKIIISKIFNILDLEFPFQTLKKYFFSRFVIIDCL